MSGPINEDQDIFPCLCACLAGYEDVIAALPLDTDTVMSEEGFMTPHNAQRTFRIIYHLRVGQPRTTVRGTLWSGWRHAPRLRAGVEKRCADSQQQQ